ncbi:MAG: LysR substrate-binding domain-containing protein [Candidatus Competibacterales bacterium]
MDRLTSMQVFVQVAERGSFAAAAERLEMSRAMVTKHIMALEQGLGVRLLNRTTRRLNLTEAGQIYLERSLQILADLDETERVVGNLTAVPQGMLRVNAPMSFGVRHVAPAVTSFLERYPDVRVDVALNDRVVDLVEEGFDVAIRIGRLMDSALVTRRLASARLVLCAAPSYLTQRGTPRTPGDLVHHECLNYSYFSGGDEWPFAGPTGPLAVRVSGRLRVNNADALLTAALAGAGITLQPDFVVNDAIARGELRPLLADHRPPSLGVFAVYPHRRHLSAKVRCFTDHLIEAFGDPPYWEAKAKARAKG